MAQTVPRSTAGTVKQFASIPGPASLPLVGTSLMYKLGARDKTQYHLALMDMFRQHGPLVRENIGGKTVVHVFDPEDIKNVYNVEGKRPIVPPLQVKKLHRNGTSKCSSSDDRRPRPCTGSRRR